jgi:CO/xanthine dehydrogenase Mo-binding subunit
MQTFIQDLSPKRALRGMVFRAPFRKGKVTSLTAPDLPAGYACLQARDIPGSSIVTCAGYSLPVLAQNRVRYLGEPLLLFCGADAEILAGLAAAVALRYEEQSPKEYADLSGPYEEAQTLSFSQGEVELAFNLADQIVEGEYRVGRSDHFYPDTQGAVAYWDGKNLTVNVSTQDPFTLRSEVARCVSLPERKVRVIASRMGNSLEGKLLPSVVVAAQASLLSLATRKPVVLRLDREEDLRFTPKSPEFLIRHQTALDRDGSPVAARVQIHMDAGPFPPKDSEALRQAVQAAWGAYRIHNLEISARSLLTDHLPIDAFRASGKAQSFFAVELHTSRLQEVAQRDPFDWKKENLSHLFAVRAKGGQEDRRAPGALAVMEEVAAASNFCRKHSAYSALKKRRKTIVQAPHPLRGIGLSLCCQDGERVLDCGEQGTPACALKVVLERGRRLRIFTSLVDGGMGIYDLLSRRAASLLDLEIERVTVVPVDTQVVPNTGPSTLSRAVNVALPLLEQCCLAVKKKRSSVSPPIEVRRSLPGSKLASGGAESPRLRETAARRRAGVSKAAEARGSRAWAAAVVEVELDPVSLHSICRGVWTAVEAGSVWNKQAAARIIEGEILRALGTSCLRDFPRNDDAGGRSCSAMGLVPGLAGLPRIEVLLVDSPDRPMKGFEQLPHLAIPPAYAAAVCQATGLYIDQIPITAEVIQQCLQT